MEIQAADRDQVMTYAINLLEFHSLTQKMTAGSDGIIIVPVVTLTDGKISKKPKWPGLGDHSWKAAANRPLESDSQSLVDVFEIAFKIACFSVRVNR